MYYVVNCIFWFNCHYRSIYTFKTSINIILDNYNFRFIIIIVAKLRNYLLSFKEDWVWE